MTVEVIQPRKTSGDRRIDVRLERLRIKREREEHLLTIAEKIILNPAVLYTVLVIGLEWLATHPNEGWQIFGWRPSGGKVYLDPDVAKLITGGLTAGLAANALGGGQGIADIIKAIK